MEKTYNIATTARCHRFKTQALQNHVTPGIKTVYEIVTFDQEQKAIVLYVGLAWDKDLYQSLEEHLEGKTPPAVPELIAKYGNLYFDHILPSPEYSQDDLKDIRWALVSQHHPAYNQEPVTHSNRYQTIKLQE